MAAVKSVHTTPEMIVRRIVHAIGFRYRLHVPELPGKPDLVFPRLGKIIDVRRLLLASARVQALPNSLFTPWLLAGETRAQTQSATKKRSASCAKLAGAFSLFGNARRSRNGLRRCRKKIADFLGD